MDYIAKVYSPKLSHDSLGFFFNHLQINKHPQKKNYLFGSLSTWSKWYFHMGNSITILTLRNNKVFFFFSFKRSVFTRRLPLPLPLPLRHRPSGLRIRPWRRCIWGGGRGSGRHFSKERLCCECVDGPKIRIPVCAGREEWRKRWVEEEVSGGRGEWRKIRSKETE